MLSLQTIYMSLVMMYCHLNFRRHIKGSFHERLTLDVCINEQAASPVHCFIGHCLLHDHQCRKQTVLQHFNVRNLIFIVPINQIWSNPVSTSPRLIFYRLHQPEHVLDLVNFYGTPLMHWIPRGVGNIAVTITFIPQEKLSGLRWALAVAGIRWKCHSWLFYCEWQMDIFTWDVFAYF